MLRCTELSEELEENQESNGNALPCLLDANNRHHPDNVDALLEGQERPANLRIEDKQ